MEKEIATYFGKKNYLIGKGKDDKNVYLVAPSWDCDWYWGFGYLETYTRRYGQLDIDMHTHFSSLGEQKNYFDGFKEYFKETPLNDNEIWTLCDYMKTFYTLKETAEIFKHGYSWYTEKAKIDDLQRTDLENEINQKMLPQLFEKIDKLLTPQEKGE